MGLSEHERRKRYEGFAEQRALRGDIVDSDGGNGGELDRALVRTAMAGIVQSGEAADDLTIALLGHVRKTLEKMEDGAALPSRVQGRLGAILRGVQAVRVAAAARVEAPTGTTVNVGVQVGGGDASRGRETAERYIAATTPMLDVNVSTNSAVHGGGSRETPG